MSSAASCAGRAAILHPEAQSQAQIYTHNAEPVRNRDGVTLPMLRSDIPDCSIQVTALRSVNVRQGPACTRIPGRLLGTSGRTVDGQVMSVLPPGDFRVTCSKHHAANTENTENACFVFALLVTNIIDGLNAPPVRIIGF